MRWIFLTIISILLLGELIYAQEDHSWSRQDSLVQIMNEGRYLTAELFLDDSSSGIEPWLEELLRCKVAQARNRPKVVLDRVRRALQGQNMLPSWVDILLVDLALTECYKSDDTRTRDWLREYVTKNAPKYGQKELYELRSMLHADSLRENVDSLNLIYRATYGKFPYRASMGTDSIPIKKSQKGMPVIPARVNGTTCDILVDTGALNAEMPFELVEALGLSYKLGRFTDLAGREIAGLVVIDSLTIGGTTFYDIPITVSKPSKELYPSDLELPDFFKVISVGNDILRKFNYVDFDFDRNHIYFHRVLPQPPSKERSNMIEISHIYVSSQINNTSVDMVLDSGGNTCLDMNVRVIMHNPQAFREAKIDPVEQGGTTTRSFGLTKSTEQYKISSPVISISGRDVVLNDDRNHIHPDSEGSELFGYDAILGYRGLRQLGKKIRFDYLNMRFDILD